MNIRTIRSRVTIRKHIFLVIFYAFCVIVCSAQAWTYRSDNYAGLSSGEWGNYGLLQTVHGVYHGPWFIGGGAGLDYYLFRSVPLFLSVTRDLPVPFKHGGLPVKRRGFYVELDGGTNLPWYKRTIEPFDEFTESKFHAGGWWSAGVGYKWKLSAAAQSRKALLLSVAYSEKRLKETVIGPAQPCYTSSCPMIVNTGQQTYIYEYLNRVFLFKLGFQF
jgi:hypothetical protein